MLAAFRRRRDEGAFAELVRRHGPLVWGACHRLLPDDADAEDAFQATFLVLVRKSPAHPAVGPWLHRVAVLTVRNLRRKNARLGFDPDDSTARLEVGVNAATRATEAVCRCPRRYAQCHQQRSSHTACIP